MKTIAKGHHERLLLQRKAPGEESPCIPRGDGEWVMQIGVISIHWGRGGNRCGKKGHKPPEKSFIVHGNCLNVARYTGNRNVLEELGNRERERKLVSHFQRVRGA